MGRPCPGTPRLREVTSQRGPQGAGAGPRPPRREGFPRPAEPAAARATWAGHRETCSCALLQPWLGHCCSPCPGLLGPWGRVLGAPLWPPVSKAALLEGGWRPALGSGGHVLLAQLQVSTACSTCSPEGRRGRSPVLRPVPPVEPAGPAIPRPGDTARIRFRGWARVRRAACVTPWGGLPGPSPAQHRLLPRPGADKALPAGSSSLFSGTF